MAVHHLDTETGRTYCGQDTSLVEKVTTTLLMVSCTACNRIYYEIVAISTATVEDFL